MPIGIGFALSPTFLISEYGGSTLVFDAATYDLDTYEATLQLTGEGTPTSTHTATIYAKDYLGLYRKFGEDEPVWELGRKVRNLATQSNDVSHADWTKSNLTPTASTLTASAANGTCLQTYSGTGSFVYSVKLSRITGTGNVDITADGGSTWTTVTLTTSYQRFTVSAYDETNPQFGIRIVTDTDAVNISEQQLEDVEATTLHRTRTESTELVTNGTFDTDTGWAKGTGWTIGSSVATGASVVSGRLEQSDVFTIGKKYLIEFDINSIANDSVTVYAGTTNAGALSTVGHNSVILECAGYTYIQFAAWAGSNLDIEIDNVTVRSLVEVAPGEYVPTTTAAAQKVFANENGNSVSSNVVTENVGNALTNQPWLVYQPAATNLIAESRDLTDAVWTKAGGLINQYDRIGITGENSTASYIEDDNGAGNESLYYTVTVTADTTSAARVFIKKDTDETRFPLFASQLTNGAAKTAYFWLNTKTGASTISGADSANGSMEVISDGEWWKVVMSHADTGANTSKKTTIYPAVGIVIGTLNNTATGSIIVGNVEVYDKKTIAEVRGLGPIFTSGATGTTDRTVYQFDINNHDNAQGAYYLEYKSTLNAAALAGISWDYITLDGGPLGNVVYQLAAQLKSYDDVNAAQVNSTFTVGNMVNNAQIYSASKSKMRVAEYGLWGSEATYDGAYNTGTDIELFDNTLLTHRIRNIKRYDLDYDDAKTQIDADMVDYVTHSNFDTVLTHSGEDITH